MIGSWTRKRAQPHLARWAGPLFACLLIAACATTPPAPAHGVISRLSVARRGAAFCEHAVPMESCARCHPDLTARFKAVGDWCGEHGVPESQCLICHPDLSFAPLPEVPANADVKRLSDGGEDVPSLAVHAVLGKITIFDFYADWCAPCRTIDEHVYALLRARGDLALRKLNVSTWETPLAKRHLREVASLPFIVVFGKDGRDRGRVVGLDLAALDRLLDEGGSAGR